MKGKKILSYIPILLAVFVLFHPGFSEKKLVQSTWTSLPAAIDASEEEWSGEALISEESAGADYAFRNDANNLYILFIIKDKNYLSTLEATGITIYCNAEGKQKKDRGIRFFKRQATPDELILALERQGQVLSEEQKEEIKSRPSYLLYDCELIKKNKVSPIEIPPGFEYEPPTFKHAKKGEMTVFEFRIPLSQENQAAGIGVEPGGSFKIGFEWGGLTKEMQAARLARVAAASERGVESETASENHARGSRSESSSTGASSSGISRTGPKKYSFWLDVKLASS